MKSLKDEIFFLGLDIGSISISHVLLNKNLEQVDSAYQIHHGKIFEQLLQLSRYLTKIVGAQPVYCAFNQKAADFFKAGLAVNEQVAQIEGIQNSTVRSLFSIGGETFGMILFDKQGNYKKYIFNSGCAAGTGSFLDQQALRLGLKDSGELSKLAGQFTGEPPKIATRCAVFAKTDLIHCQQQGYSTAAISAGLCKGLAQNISDTLVKGIHLSEPVWAIGGVSKNQKVMQYLSSIIGRPITVPPQSRRIGALGCARLALRSYQQKSETAVVKIPTFLKKQSAEKSYFYPPLTSKLAQFPSFDEHQHYISNDVEVDLYSTLQKGKSYRVYMGIDIGSTSTKAVLLESAPHIQVLLGLYTRTMGSPIQALQTLLRVLDELSQRHQIQFDFLGVGTTGSGRKFSQKVISADEAIDEITAHARAAVFLNPEIDTIIEIGGQDAKFTVLKNGQVTFSVMNYVCAAGTGSFIEEQAKRLDVPLEEYSAIATGKQAPMTSDRCTVFMERDLNHLLSQGYSRDELLAAALHSVRDNYLTKVAHLNKIGQAICFQGATAKNKALVMAFEQKLNRPIFVSRYCHLTGALGVCLMLNEQKIVKSTFRGINFYKETLIIEDDVCEQCQNNCKLKKVQIGDSTIYWGYLCGRDENGRHPNSKKRAGFNLLSNRRRIFNSHLDFQKERAIAEKPLLDNLLAINFENSFYYLKESLGVNLLQFRHHIFTFNQSNIPPEIEKHNITIGIPNTLYLMENAPFWHYFFRKLGYRVMLTQHKPDLLNEGKELAGADFCAPISNWFGHVEKLAKSTDYLFLPQMMKETEPSEPMYYCYYSNYAASMAMNNSTNILKANCIMPIIDFNRPAIENIEAIYESLPDKLKLVHAPTEIQQVFQNAMNWFTQQKQELIHSFKQQMNASKEMAVVLLGRPYLVLDPVMNKNIPEKFNTLGIRTFYQDMLPISEEKNLNVQYLNEWNHWKFGAQILKAAEYLSKHPQLYPVFLTAFKCSPDSFILNYFRQMMDLLKKPYLILQLDEHGSDIGYETRIESAVRSFRHHFLTRKSSSAAKHQNTQMLAQLSRDQVVLLPNYDNMSCQLMAAAFERAGYQALTIEETATTIQESLRLNDGQCLPIAAITQATIHTIQKHNFDPKKTILFINALTQTACNLPQYPYMIRTLLNQAGKGFENIQIFATEFEMRSLPFEVIYDVYCSYLLGGLIRKIGCKLRPYEKNKGETDQIIDHSVKIMYHAIATGGSKEAAFEKIVTRFSAITMQSDSQPRPQAGILGDLYVRDNDIFNQRLIQELERNGAEVITTPFNYVLRILAVKHKRHLRDSGHYLQLFRDGLFLELLEQFEKRFFNIANRILQEEFPVFDESIFDNLTKYDLSIQHGGETVQNVLKIFSLLEHYPKIQLFVHVNPIFCCPGLVSESIFKKLEQDIGIPIVSIIYDGTKSNKNDVLVPYLHFSKGKLKNSNPDLNKCGGKFNKTINDNRN